MHDHESDVAVVGGGLAGGSAALAFAQQDARSACSSGGTSPAIRTVGTLCTSPTVEIARRLGIVDLLEARGATALKAMETVDPDGTLSFKTGVEGSLILNHAELESVFLAPAECHGAVLQSDVARSLTWDAPDAGWLVDTDHGSTRARFVVGADGAGSLTRRTLGIELADDYEYDNCIAVLHGTRPSWLEPEHGWQLIHPDGAVFILPTTPEGRARLVVLIRRSETEEWMTSSEAELAERLGRSHSLLRGLELTKRGGSHVYAAQADPCRTVLGTAGRVGRRRRPHHPFDGRPGAEHRHSGLGQARRGHREGRPGVTAGLPQSGRVRPCPRPLSQCRRRPRLSPQVRHTVRWSGVTGP